MPAAALLHQTSQDCQSTTMEPDLGIVTIFVVIVLSTAVCLLIDALRERRERR